MKNVIILRGISGSGKTEFANLIAEPKIICTADDFFMKDGEYKWVASNLGHAHRACMDKFDAALANDLVENIVIANTNCKASDFRYYEDEAKKVGARVTFVVLEKRHDNENIHFVPYASLMNQFTNLCNSVKFK